MRMKDSFLIPSSDELIELDFDLVPPAADDDEWSSFLIVPAPIKARTITQIFFLNLEKMTYDEPHLEKKKSNTGYRWDFIWFCSILYIYIILTNKATINIIWQTKGWGCKLRTHYNKNTYHSVIEKIKTNESK